jgi:hypothetical protein
MKMKMCKCLWSGLVRPKGPIQIKSTKILSPDVMVARLSGPTPATISVVKLKNRFYVKAPEKLGGTCEVPADHLTDAVNYRVFELNNELKKKKSRKKS